MIDSGTTLLSALEYRDNGDGTATVAREFVYKFGANGAGLRVIVPAGFVTDFASVPWPFSIIIPRFGNANAAAVIHDYLYELARKHQFPRVIADAIFLAIMARTGVGFLKRATMYLAVRLFGWITIKL